MGNPTRYEKQKKRSHRIRLKIKAKSNRLRLSVFRSSKNFYAQIIDDRAGKTLVFAGPKDLDQKLDKKTKKEKARALGEILAHKADSAKIKEVVFDRGTYRFHGRVREFAEGAREAGLKF